MRKISFKLLTQTSLVSIMSNARTFGELQKEIKNHATLSGVVVFGKSQFIDSVEKTQYGTIPEAILPATDFMFYVVPTETKSGCDLPSVEEVNEMSYMELRSLASKLNKENGATVDLSGKRVDVLPRVVEWLKAQINVQEEEEETPVSVEDEIIAHAEKIIQLVAELKSSLKAQVDEVVYKLTYAEVEEEANRLKNLFK